MTIAAAELELIRNSFDRLTADLDTHSANFYEALFRRAPHLREMFREDLAGQGMKFMTTLGVIVDKLDDEEAIAEQYKGLGSLHSSLGVQVHHFEPMREALIDTLRSAQGPEFNHELEKAWRKAFDQVSANMIRRGDIGSDD